MAPCTDSPAGSLWPAGHVYSAGVFLVVPRELGPFHGRVEINHVERGSHDEYATVVTVI